jgi:hypothetical protein
VCNCNIMCMGRTVRYRGIKGLLSPSGPLEHRKELKTYGAYCGGEPWRPVFVVRHVTYFVYIYAVSASSS